MEHPRPFASEWLQASFEPARTAAQLPSAAGSRRDFGGRAWARMNGRSHRGFLRERKRAGQRGRPCVVQCGARMRTRQMITELLVSGTPEKWIEGKFFTPAVSTLIYIIVLG